MNQSSQGGGSQAAPRHRPTGIDLILQARAMRHRWFATTLARLSTSLARAGAQRVARAGRTRRSAAPEALRFSTGQ